MTVGGVTIRTPLMRCRITASPSSTSSTPSARSSGTFVSTAISIRRLPVNRYHCLSKKPLTLRVRQFVHLGTVFLNSQCSRRLFFLCLGSGLFHALLGVRLHPNCPRVNASAGDQDAPLIASMRLLKLATNWQYRPHNRVNQYPVAAKDVSTVRPEIPSGSLQPAGGGPPRGAALNRLVHRHNHNASVASAHDIVRARLVALANPRRDKAFTASVP